jgi:hypothetical protein
MEARVGRWRRRAHAGSLSRAPAHRGRDRRGRRRDAAIRMRLRQEPGGVAGGGEDLEGEFELDGVGLLVEADANR